ncbi:hypothetical protein [Amaricoccus macauensis]|uniref:hypothetical protein n=1 Tax=Amaricoccus macauensis TaxID=57001 RepID=UPI003C7B4140
MGIDVTPLGLVFWDDMASVPAYTYAWQSYVEIAMMSQKNSIFDKLGLPEPSRHVLFVISLFALASPYLAGADFGAFKFPNLSHLGLNLYVIGPVFFLACVLCYIPFWPKSDVNEKSRSLSSISREKLRSGLSLGWQLGRYEFAADSIFEEARQAAPEILRDIREITHHDSLDLPENIVGFQALMSKILNFYSSTDIEKHCAILVGNSAMRASLVGASKDPDSNQEMKRLAYSSLQEADSSIVSKKESLFEEIIRKKPSNIPELIEIIEGLQT